MNAAFKESGYVGEAQSTAAAVSSQWNQSRTLFKKKRKSKAAIKRQLRWKSFTDKVEKAVNSKVLSTRCFALTSIGQHSSVAGKQGVTTVELLPANGATAGVDQDLVNLFTAEGLSVLTQELYLRTARLDITLKNNNGTETAIVDAYEVKFRPMPDDYNTAGQSVFTMLQDMTLAMSTQTGAGSSLLIDEVGWTPYVASEITKYVSVLNHTRFILGTGQHQTYTIKDSYNKAFNLGAVADFCVVPYETKAVIFIISGRPNAGAATADFLGHYPAVGIDFEFNRTYWYQRITGNLAYVGEK